MSGILLEACYLAAWALKLGIFLCLVGLAAGFNVTRD